MLKALALTVIITLNLISCSKSDIVYYDDRTDIQLQDNNFLIKNKLTLNKNKHVLIFGIDGLEYQKIPKNMINKSFFKSNFRTQSYETFKGWKSIIWGNILELGKNVFQLIKDNNYDLKNATYLQNLGQYWTKDIFNNSIQKNIDEYSEINDLHAKQLDNLEKYMSELYDNSFKLINGLLPTCTCGGNNEIEWVQQCFSNRTGLFKIYSKFEEKQMYHVFLNKFEYF
ncbi:hypothetical protein SIXOD_v1c27690 (plasmid) [Spiroplasma ixodetis Y32]|nr:hypothetical protein SIXOD_v1c27690 [Spiroplasma ixodetis Y32]